MSTGAWKEYFHLGYSLAKAELSVSGLLLSLATALALCIFSRVKGSWQPTQCSQEQVSALETEAKKKDPMSWGERRARSWYLKDLILLLCFLSYSNELQSWAFKLVTEMGWQTKQEVVYDPKLRGKKSVRGHFNRLSDSVCVDSLAD